MFSKSSSPIKSRKLPQLKLIFLSTIIFTVIFSAGCLIDEKEPDIVNSTQVNIPEELNDGIQQVNKDLAQIELSTVSDIHALSENIKKAESFSDRSKIILEYYSNNAWIDSIVYYDAASNLYSSCPVILNSADVIGSIPYPTEKELRSAENGIISDDCVFIPEHGYMNMNCIGVFDDDGRYIGYFMVFTDLYVQLNLHPLVMDKEKSYSDFIVFIVDDDGKIIYSSRQEAIGETITKDKPFWNSEVFIKKVTSDSGAYKYTSNAFYLNCEGVETEKITAWHIINRGKSSYTIYAVEELNRPELKEKDAFELNIENTTRDVKNLYSYDDWNGIQKAIERVNSGYYSTDICIMDMNGEIVASSEPMIIGLSLLNNRGAYGYAYVASMIDTVKQGGGYVYYTLPIDGTVDSPAARYTISYVLPLDTDYFVMGSFAGDSDLVLDNNILRSDVTTVSRELVRKSYYDGIESVIDKINNNTDSGSSIFVDGVKTEIKDISIVGFNGEVYASVYYHDDVGESATGYTDVYGGSITRKAIILAKNGGGIMTNLLPNKDKEGYVDLWLISIDPIDNQYYSYVGTVLKTFKDELSPYLTE